MRTALESHLVMTDHDESVGDASEGPAYAGLILNVTRDELLSVADDDGTCAAEAREIGKRPVHYLVVLSTDGFVDVERFTNKGKAMAAFKRCERDYAAL